MPKISVIIPVYNVEKYLRPCLDSVLNQTFQDIEVICVNDGSPDKSGEILSNYARQDSRIKIITQENQGLSAARNAGVDIATGDWICFVDSDDFLPNYALMVLYEIAQKSECKIVASRDRLSAEQYEAIQQDNISIAPSFSYHLESGLKDFVKDSKIYSSAWNKLFAKELFQTQRFKEGMLFEDWPVMTILFGRVNKYAITEIPCYVYREDNNSITRSSFSFKKIDSYIEGVRMVYQAYKDTRLLSYARKRMAVAVKMLVNKVYRTKDKALAEYTIQQIQQLFTDGIMSPHFLSLKTRYRLWRLKHL